MSEKTNTAATANMITRLIFLIMCNRQGPRDDALSEEYKVTFHIGPFEMNGEDREVVTILKNMTPAVVSL